MLFKILPDIFFVAIGPSVPPFSIHTDQSTDYQIYLLAHIIGEKYLIR